MPNIQSTFEFFHKSVWEAYKKIVNNNLAIGVGLNLLNFYFFQ
jgi:hypothetical protein